MFIMKNPTEPLKLGPIETHKDTTVNDDNDENTSEHLHTTMKNLIEMNMKQPPRKKYDTYDILPKNRPPKG